MLDKISKVIESCKTLDQMDTAENYIWLARPFLTKEERLEVWEIFSRKDNELEEL